MNQNISASLSWRIQVVFTEAPQNQVVQWLITEVQQRGTETNIADKSVENFHQFFREVKENVP